MDCNNFNAIYFLFSDNYEYHTVYRNKSIKTFFQDFYAYFILHLIVDFIYNNPSKATQCNLSLWENKAQLSIIGKEMCNVFLFQ